MLVTLHEMCKVPFRLLGRNGFHLTAENERFTSAGSRYRQSLKFEKIHSCPLTDFVKKLHQKACRTCSKFISPHSTNHIIDLWRCGYRRLLLNSQVVLGTMMLHKRFL